MNFEKTLPVEPSREPQPENKVELTEESMRSRLEKAEKSQESWKKEYDQRNEILKSELDKFLTPAERTKWRETFGTLMVETHAEARRLEPIPSPTEVKVHPITPSEAKKFQKANQLQAESLARSLPVNDLMLRFYSSDLAKVAKNIEAVIDKDKLLQIKKAVIAQEWLEESMRTGFEVTGDEEFDKVNIAVSKAKEEAALKIFKKLPQEISDALLFGNISRFYPSKVEDVWKEKLEKMKALK